MSNRNSILLVDPSFDPVSAKNCTLLINIGLDYISYAIVDNGSKRVNVVFDEQECENTIKKFADRIKSDAYLTHPFQTVKIAVHTENRINVPNELYDESNLTAQTQFFSGGYTNNVYVQPQEKFDFTTIFALPKTLDLLLSEHFPEAGLTTNMPSAVLNVGNNLTINFSVGSFSLTYTQHEQFIFEQTYEITDVEEFNYYLLLVINQLAIDTRKTHLYLSGIVHEGDERYQCLSKYFPQLSFLTVNPQLQQEILEDMPAHYYVNLLALYPCE